MPKSSPSQGMALLKAFSMSDSSSVKALPKITIMEHTAGEVLPADFDK